MPTQIEMRRADFMPVPPTAASWLLAELAQGMREAKFIRSCGSAREYHILMCARKNVEYWGSSLVAIDDAPINALIAKGLLALERQWDYKGVTNRAYVAPKTHFADTMFLSEPNDDGRTTNVSAEAWRDFITACALATMAQWSPCQSKHALVKAIEASEYYADNLASVTKGSTECRSCGERPPFCEVCNPNYWADLRDDTINEGVT